MWTADFDSLRPTNETTLHRRHHQIRGLLAALTLCAAGFACSGDESSPATTTAPTPATPSRVISVSGNLDFGSVDVGSSKSATLTISNSGNSTLTISGMTATSGLAGVLTANSPASVPASGSVTATIRFSPTSATPYAGTLSVTADHTSGTNTIGVSGIGVSPTLTCNVTLSPSSVTIGTSGSSAKATIQVTVASGCTWTAAADSWLTLRPTSGTGSGAVEVEGINYGGSARTTTLRIGNATAMVTQSGGSGSGGSGGSGGGNGGSGPTCPKPGPAPVGTTAVCNDGTYSQSQNRSGTCSSHGGVSCWVCPGTLCSGFGQAPNDQSIWLR